MWINAYKRKPKPGMDVLCYDYMGNFFVGYIDACGNWWVVVYDDNDKMLDAENISVHRWRKIKPPKRSIKFLFRLIKSKIAKGINICDMFGRKKKMIFYCNAVVSKEPGFNWLKYEMNDSDENSRFLEQFKHGQRVRIYVEKTNDD